MDAVDEATDELFRIPPEDFVAERDARVAAAKESGDKDTAKAIGALRRPSKPAWLVNLLVHDRRDEVDGLLGLAETLASAQRTLDGAGLRQLSAQRNKLVGALSRRAAELGRAAGHRVDSGLERDVRGILESALANPELAGRVRSGRLAKAERHAGFGPEPDAGAEPRPGGRGSVGTGGGGRPGGDRRSPGGSDDGGGGPGSGEDGAGSGGRSGDGDTGDGGDRASAEERRAAERREREIVRAEAELEKAEQASRTAHETHDRAADASDAATHHQEATRERVAELVDELERARDEYASANRAAHAAAREEKDTARAARTADTARDRAAAALDELRSS